MDHRKADNILLEVFPNDFVCCPESLKQRLLYIMYFNSKIISLWFNCLSCHNVKFVLKKKTTQTHWLIHTDMYAYVYIQLHSDRICDSSTLHIKLYTNRTSFDSLSCNTVINTTFPSWRKEVCSKPTSWPSHEEKEWRCYIVKSIKLRKTQILIRHDLLPKMLILQTPIMQVQLNKNCNLIIFWYLTFFEWQRWSVYKPYWLAAQFGGNGKGFLKHLILPRFTHCSFFNFNFILKVT